MLLKCSNKGPGLERLRRLRERNLAAGAGDRARKGDEGVNDRSTNPLLSKPSNPIIQSLIKVTPYVPTEEKPFNSKPDSKPKSYANKASQCNFPSVPVKKPQSIYALAKNWSEIRL